MEKEQKTISIDDIIADFELMNDVVNEPDEQKFIEKYCNPDKYSEFLTRLKSLLQQDDSRHMMSNRYNRIKSLRISYLRRYPDDLDNNCRDDVFRPIEFETSLRNEMQTSRRRYARLELRKKIWQKQDYEFFCGSLGRTIDERLSLLNASFIMEMLQVAKTYKRAENERNDHYCLDKNIMFLYFTNYLLEAYPDFYDTTRLGFAREIIDKSIQFFNFETANMERRYNRSAIVTKKKIDKFEKSKEDRQIEGPLQILAKKMGRFGKKTKN